MHVISVEKAVACDDGTIVAICLRNCATSLCQPWDTPMTASSTDGGKTWSEPKELCQYKGRVYDARYYNGVIYVLEFCNDGTGDFCGEKDEHLYRIFTSHDNGKSFEELCVVPFASTRGRGYGTMLFDDKGKLHVYAYNKGNEHNLDHIVSDDCGKTWGHSGTSYVGKGSRNPQTAIMDGVYILHARADKCSGFVVYSSEDGAVWDEGEYIVERKALCYYSNNIVLKDKENKNRLLIQYSDCYEKDCVNIKHLWLNIVR